VGNFLADRFGDAVYHYARKSRRHAISNMSHVLGPGATRERLRKPVHGVFRNVMRNYFDLCRAPEMRDADIDRLVEFDERGWQKIVDYQKAGRGVILVTAHFGSFDMMTQVIARRGLPLTALIARVKPAWLSDFISHLRGWRGMDLLFVDEEEGSGVNLSALKNAIATLRGGGMLGVLVDRNMEQQGVSIPFFGEQTKMAAGVAKMALRTRAVVVPSICLRLPRGRYSLTFAQPIEPTGSASNEEDVKALLTGIFSHFERYIRRYPEQWVLLQSAWREDEMPKM
jgi:KDO2-lipid IV(A) lauroyltransferase